MKENLLIVEDEYIVANDLRIMLQNSGYSVCGISGTVEAAKKAVDKFKPTWVLLDIFLQDDSMGTDLAPYLQEKNIGFIYISANTNQSILEMAKATQPYGFLVKPFREKDLLIMLDIARGKHQSDLQFTLQHELMLRTQLKNLMEGPINHEQVILKIPGTFQAVIPFDLLEYKLVGATGENMGCGFLRVGFDEYQVLGAEIADQNDSDRPAITKAINETAGIFNDILFVEQLSKNLQKQKIASRYGLNSHLKFVGGADYQRLELGFYNKRYDAYNQSHLTLLQKSQGYLTRFFQLISSEPQACAKVTTRRAARVNPVAEPAAAARFDGIYGKSAPLLQVLDNIEMVANTPVSVLILGESGTGKEKVAHNIHFLSGRKSKSFVTVNCAALPAELIESELFGHERGAFTGAFEKRTGKFELADGGTIFLDEIGEMPLESQVKLLRVLQEKEFAYVGSSKTIKVDVRIIAATNKNLEKEVAEGRFRLDLFYRLNVFPLELPPLRERKEDIPILANHFLIKSARLMGRSEVPQLSAEALKELQGYDWPGNIRELEHLMERALIRTRGNLIKEVSLPKNFSKPTSTVPADGNAKTLEQHEVEHILNVLKSCNGKVFGAGGAAEILGLPPSTLTSRMKKLGIKRELYHDR